MDVDDDDDGDDMDLLDGDEADEIRSELGEHLGRILAKRGLKGSDVGKLYAPKAPAVSPAAAAALASVASNTSGAAAHDATVAAQRAAVERNNVQTLADRAAGRAAEEFNGRLGGGRLTRPAGGKIEGKI